MKRGILPSNFLPALYSEPTIKHSPHSTASIMFTANNSPTGKSTMAATTDDLCSICFERRPRCVFSRCSHGCCKECFMRWVEKEESNGQPSASCPFCRSILRKEDLIDILGREFRPSTPMAGVRLDESEIDDLTMQFLLEAMSFMPRTDHEVGRL